MEEVAHTVTGAGYAFPPSDEQWPQEPPGYDRYLPAYEPDINVAGMRAAIKNERGYLRRLDQSGRRDLALSLGVMGTGGILQVMHDGFLATKEYGYGVATSHDIYTEIYTKIAELPVDWRSVAAVAGVIATKSAAQRIRKAEQFAQAEARDDGSLEQLVTVDPHERRTRRMLERLGRGALTLGFGLIAYKSAEHVSPSYSEMTGITTGFTAIAGITYLKMRTEQIISRRRRY